MPRFATQPQFPTPIDWGNPITRGLRFAYLPGFMRDAVTSVAATSNSGAYTKIGSSIITQGAVANTGLITGTGQLLGPLTTSTIVAVAARYNGTTNLLASGSAIYCERGASGNDIYKLGIRGGGVNSEFTWRNDGGTLRQLWPAMNNNQMSDNRAHFYAARVDGLNNVLDSWAEDVTVNSAIAGFAFTDSVTRTIGSDFADTDSKWDGRIDLVAGWGRALSNNEIKSLRISPYQIFKLQPLRALLVTQLRVTIYPNSDVATSGWFPSTGSTIYGVIDEEVPDDADYAISPPLSTPGPATMGLSESVPAGTYTVRVRGLRTNSEGQLRINLLNGSNVVQGSSSWQALTNSYATYSLTVTTTGTATRIQIEVAP